MGVGVAVTRDHAVPLHGDQRAWMAVWLDLQQKHVVWEAAGTERPELGSGCGSLQRPEQGPGGR